MSCVPEHSITAEYHTWQGHSSALAPCAPLYELISDTLSQPNSDTAHAAAMVQL